MKADELGDSPWKFAGVGFVYAKAGHREQVTKVLAKLDEASRHGLVAPFYSAAVHVGISDIDEALRLLQRAARERNLQINVSG